MSKYKTAESLNRLLSINPVIKKTIYKQACDTKNAINFYSPHSELDYANGQPYLVKTYIDKLELSAVMLNACRQMAMSTIAVDIAGMLVELASESKTINDILTFQKKKI